MAVLETESRPITTPAPQPERAQITIGERERGDQARIALELAKAVRLKKELEKIEQKKSEGKLNETQYQQAVERAKEENGMSGFGVMLWREQRKLAKALREEGRTTLAEIAGNDQALIATYELLEASHQKAEQSKISLEQLNNQVDSQLKNILRKSLHQTNPRTFIQSELRQLIVNKNLDGFGGRAELIRAIHDGSLSNQLAEFVSNIQAGEGGDANQVINQLSFRLGEANTGKAYDKSLTLSERVIMGKVGGLPLVGGLSVMAARGATRVVTTGALAGAGAGFLPGLVVSAGVGAVSGAVGGAANKIGKVLRTVSRQEEMIALGLKSAESQEEKTAHIKFTDLARLYQDDPKTFIIRINTLNRALEKGDLALVLDDLESVKNFLGIQNIQLEAGRVNLLAYQAIVRLLNVKRDEALQTQEAAQIHEIAFEEVSDYVTTRAKAARERRWRVLGEKAPEIAGAGGLGLVFGAGSALGVNALSNSFIGEYISNKAGTVAGRVSRGAELVAQKAGQATNNVNLEELRNRAVALGNRTIEKLAEPDSSALATDNSAAETTTIKPGFGPTNPESELSETKLERAIADNLEPNETTDQAAPAEIFPEDSLELQLPTLERLQDIVSQNPDIMDWDPNVDWAQSRLYISYNLGVIAEEVPELKNLLENNPNRVAMLAEIIQADNGEVAYWIDQFLQNHEAVERAHLGRIDAIADNTRIEIYNASGLGQELETLVERGNRLDPTEAALELGNPLDSMPIRLVVTNPEGVPLIEETVFENRWDYSINNWSNNGDQAGLYTWDKFSPGPEYESRIDEFGSNIAFGGHCCNAERTFGDLPKLETGDIIKIQTESGLWYEYTVTETQVLPEGPAAGRLVEPYNYDSSVNEATLVTCNPNNWDERVIVVAQEVVSEEVDTEPVVENLIPEAPIEPITLEFQTLSTESIPFPLEHPAFVEALVNYANEPDLEYRLKQLSDQELSEIISFLLRPEHNWTHNPYSSDLETDQLISLIQFSKFATLEAIERFYTNPEFEAALADTNNLETFWNSQDLPPSKVNDKLTTLILLRDEVPLLINGDLEARQALVNQINESLARPNNLPELPPLEQLRDRDIGFIGRANVEDFLNRYADLAKADNDYAWNTLLRLLNPTSGEISSDDLRIYTNYAEDLLTSTKHGLYGEIAQSHADAFLGGLATARNFRGFYENLPIDLINSTGDLVKEKPLLSLLAVLILIRLVFFPSEKEKSKEVRGEPKQKPTPRQERERIRELTGLTPDLITLLETSPELGSLKKVRPGEIPQIIATLQKNVFKLNISRERKKLLIDYLSSLSKSLGDGTLTKAQITDLVAAIEAMDSRAPGSNAAPSPTPAKADAPQAKVEVGNYLSADLVTLLRQSKNELPNLRAVNPKDFPRIMDILQQNAFRANLSLDRKTALAKYLSNLNEGMRRGTLTSNQIASLVEAINVVYGPTQTPSGRAKAA